ncbi:MAG: ERF family protein [Solirubrobacterales bacterium]|nr:ERF family protein [Solirubrobacterales bacterium]
MEHATPELFAAIVAAQGHAQAVAKASYNAFSKYRYASSEDVIAESREALNKAGLALIPQTTSVAHEEGRGLVLKASYRLVHGGGSCLMVEGSFVIPQNKIGEKAPDKAEAAARTYLLAYTLRDLLLLPRVEEEQVDQRPPQREVSRPAPTQSKPKADPADAGASELEENGVPQQAALDQLMRHLADAVGEDVPPIAAEAKRVLRGQYLDSFANAYRNRVRELREKGAAA